MSHPGRSVGSSRHRSMQEDIVSHAIRVDPILDDPILDDQILDDPITHVPQGGAWDPDGDWVEVVRVDAGPLAPVISLDAYRQPAARPSRGTYLRRRILAGLGLAAAVLALVLIAGGSIAEAGAQHQQVVGRATIAPGETLWDVAVANAPQDVDPRDYLASIRRLNDLEGRPVAAWTVVLLPAG